MWLEKEKESQIRRKEEKNMGKGGDLEVS